MPVTVIYTANNQSTSSQSMGIGTGVATDLHVIRMAVKALTTDVPANPAGYADVPGTTQISGGHVVARACYRILPVSPAAPSVNGAGVALLTSSEVYRGFNAASPFESDGTVDLFASQTLIRYQGKTIATSGCMVSLWGVFGTSGAGTFGVPSSLSGSAVNQVVNYVGSNLRSTLWTDLQIAPVEILDGNIAITGAGAVNTNRSILLVIRPAVSTTVTISDVEDELFYHGETGIDITCTAAGAQAGLAKVLISPTDDVTNVLAVQQTVTAWANTLVTITGVLSSFAAFTNLYLFIMDSAGVSNSAGFVVQRQKRFRVSDTIRDRGDGDDAAVNWASKAGVGYRITADSPIGHEELSGVDGTTDASGIFTSSYILLTNGGAVEDGDYVWVSLWLDNATPANVRSTLVKYLPTYV